MVELNNTAVYLRSLSLTAAIEGETSLYMYIGLNLAESRSGIFDGTASTHVHNEEIR